MDAGILHKKLARGFISLTFRKIILDIINFVTIFIILAKVLPVNIIGIYAIAQSILTFFSYFSDIGLGAALIQKKEVTQEDLKTTFFIQEVLIILIVIFIWVIAPILATLYGFDNQSMWLIRVLAIGFLLSSFKVIPSTVLERELKFEPIIFIEIIETLIFNGVLIYLTFLNFRVEAFSFAVLARSIIGAILLNLIAPWNISIGFSKSAAKSLFNFGIPFQLNSLLALLKDRLTPLITAKIVGDLGFGYLTWAQGIAYRPLEIMNILIRVSFPAFSRLQDNNLGLKKIVEKSLFITVILLYPLLFGILAVLPDFIVFMGKDKFAPAVPLIFLFALSTFWAAPSTTFTNVLNAVGKVKLTLKLMLMWTLLTWVLSPILALYFGYIGVAIAAAIISFTSIIPIIIIKKMLKIDFLGNIWQPLLSSLVMYIAVFGLSILISETLVNLFLLIAFGTMIYLLLVIVLAKNKILNTLQEFRGAA